MVVVVVVVVVVVAAEETKIQCKLMGTVEGLEKPNTDCLYIKSSGHAGGPNMVHILSERCTVTGSYEMCGRISVRCAVRFWERPTVT